MPRIFALLEGKPRHHNTCVPVGAETQGDLLLSCCFSLYKFNISAIRTYLSAILLGGHHDRYLECQEEIPDTTIKGYKKTDFSPL